jgi:hypothetical protein
MLTSPLPIGHPESQARAPSITPTRPKLLASTNTLGTKATDFPGKALARGVLNAVCQATSQEDDVPKVQSDPAKVETRIWPPR